MRMPPVLASLLVAAAAVAPALEGPRPPAAAAPVAQESTPIVVPPPPTPRPIYAPYLNKQFDPLAPEPVGNTAVGWLAALQPDGRTACAPATHVLLRYAEGTLNNAVEAVVVPAVEGLALDLFVGDHVELRGGIDLAPAGCRFLTWRMVLASRARAVPPPPP